MQNIYIRNNNSNIFFVCDQTRNSVRRVRCKLKMIVKLEDTNLNQLTGSRCLVKNGPLTDTRTPTDPRKCLIF